MINYGQLRLLYLNIILMYKTTYILCLILHLIIMEFYVINTILITLNAHKYIIECQSNYQFSKKINNMCF